MTLGLVGNPEKYEMREVAARLVSHATRRGVAVIADGDLADILSGLCPIADLSTLALCDAVIALGGDGTVLKAVHRVGFGGAPVLGVNLGTLGFLAEVPVEQLEVAVDEVIRGSVLLESRCALEVVLPDGAVVRALNEVVLDKHGASRMITMEARIDGQYLNTYVADGLIIATPTGSTAYSLSAGGPIVSPTSNVFVITPLAPHTLTARPLVVPDTSVIELTITPDLPFASLAADGVDHVVPSGTPIVIRRSSRSATFLHRPGISHFDILRAKLLWGRDARAAASKRAFRK
jgi:NAD+ kinase